MSGIVTLTTDFGYRDPFVAIMKGVIHTIRRELEIIDVTHSITPYDTMQGALCVSRFRNYFPKGTVHVVVVDPGVGSQREGIIIRTERYFYVGPNNGLFSMLDSYIEKAVKIENPKYLLHPVSATFHGRDVFAPVAAHLTQTDMAEFGPDIDKLERLDIPKPDLEDDTVSGQVIGFDHFGNAATNITIEMVNELKDKKRGGSVEVRIGSHVINSLSDYYQTGNEDSLGAIINSFDFLELFMRNANAQKKIGIKRGDGVSVRFRH